MPCIHDAFNHLGGSSLLTVELVLRMESQFGVDLPLGDIIQRNTISQQAEFVERILAASTAGATRPADARQIDAVPSLAVRLPCRVSESQTTDPRARLDLPLVRFNQHTSGVPIVCCGGYTSVAAAFLDRPVLGLETGEGLMSASDIPYLARRYVDRLVAAGDKGPFILVGYSLGAEIAMELALELSGRGTRIPWLFLVDHPVLRHYPGRVVCMLASEGPYIELPESDNWEGALKDHFPGGADLVILTGDHIRIIRPCPTNPLFRQIRYRIESAPLDPGLDVTESCHGPQSDCDRFTRHSGARRHSRDGEAGAALKPVAWAEVGWDCMENGEYHNAVDAYRKALRQSPDFNWCNQLALSLEHLGDFESAIDNWLQSMAIRPTSAYARINLAWAYYHRAEYEKALGACRFGRELDPWNLDVYLIERRCLSRLGHGDACRRLLDEVLARFSRLLFSQNRCRFYGSADAMVAPSR
jgi:pimeloyl-ACP methyl ester carboxylesterase